MTDILFDPEKLLLIAGPCVIESETLLMATAQRLCQAIEGRPVQLIFKSSYRKANRTSVSSFRGLGDEKALQLLRLTGDSFQIPVLTDIHSDYEAGLAAKYTDVLQIPAFLARQTSLLEAAGGTGRTVNIKKGQFMAPEEMLTAAEKVKAGGGGQVWLTERGTFFGYHDLVVDFRSISRMKSYGMPVIFDATHSVQKPAAGIQSGGDRHFVKPLALAALAAGADGLFLEVHPDPENALSDAATQWPLNDFKCLLEDALKVWYATRP